MLKVMFIGHLGKQPEIRYTQGGDAVASFSVAVSERWKDKSGEQQEKTEWVPCVAWKKLAEICEKYLHKGSKIYGEGKLQTRKWQDNNGNDRYTTEVILSNMEMLSPRSGNGEPPPTSGDENSHGMGSGNMDNVPF